MLMSRTSSGSGEFEKLLVARIAALLEIDALRFIITLRDMMSLIGGLLLITVVAYR